MDKTKFKTVNKNIQKLKKILQPNRVKILMILSKKETCACELVKKLDLSNNLISHHLKVLTGMKIIKSKKIGLHIKYSVCARQKTPIRKLLNCLSNYSKIGYN